MRPALARRCHTRRCGDRRRCAAVPGGDVDVRLVPVDHRDAIRGHADVALIGVGVDDARRATGESRPHCSASSHTVGRHRAEVDPGPGLGMQQVGRRSPARALWPALCQPMQLAECRRRARRSPTMTVVESGCYQGGPRPDQRQPDHQPDGGRCRHRAARRPGSPARHTPLHVLAARHPRLRLGRTAELG
jgi:hypothetical protein